MKGLVTRFSAWQVFSGTAKALKLKINPGCHGMRKFFATFLYAETGNNSVMTANIMNWKNINEVPTYASVDEDDKKDIVRAVHKKFS